jgi:hypothetical protein
MEPLIGKAVKLPANLAVADWSGLSDWESQVAANSTASLWFVGTVPRLPKSHKTWKFFIRSTQRWTNITRWERVIAFSGNAIHVIRAYYAWIIGAVIRCASVNVVCRFVWKLCCGCEDWNCWGWAVSGRTVADCGDSVSQWAALAVRETRLSSWVCSLVRKDSMSYWIYGMKMSYQYSKILFSNSCSNSKLPGFRKLVTLSDWLQ